MVKGIIYEPHRIDKIITEKSLDIKEICYNLKIYRQQFDDWRNGSTTPSAINLAKICTALDITPDHLFSIITE